MPTFDREREPGARSIWDAPPESRSVPGPAEAPSARPHHGGSAALASEVHRGLYEPEDTIRGEATGLTRSEKRVRRTVERRGDNEHVAHREREWKRSPRSYEEKHATSKTVEAHDAAAEANALEAELVATRKDAEKARKRGRMTEAERGASDRADASAAAALTELTARRGKLSSAEIEDLCRRHGITMTPKGRVLVGEGSKTESSLEVGAGTLSASGSTERSRTKDGVTRATGDSAGVEVDVGEGKASLTTGHSRSTTHADGSAATGSRETTVSGTIGGGAVLSVTHKGSGKRTDAEGKTKSGSESSHTVSGGLIAGDDGVGAQLGDSTTKSRTKDGVTTSTTSGANVAVTDKGLIGKVNAGLKKGGDKAQVGVKAGATGAILFDVAPIPDTDPPLFEVTATVKAGASLGVDGRLGKEKGKNASASFGASGRAVLTYGHTMTREELNRYLSQAEQIDEGAAPDDYPEFGVVTKLKLLGDGKADGDVSPIMGNSGAAARMEPGDSVSLVLGGGVTGGAKAGPGKGPGLGIGAKASANVTRAVTIRRLGEHKVEVTLAFLDATELEGDLSGSLLGANAGIEANQSRARGDENVFLLETTDSNYRDCYEKILGAHTPGALAALRDDPLVHAHLSRAVSTTEDAAGTKHSVGLGPLSLGVKNDGRMSQKMVMEKGKRSGSFKGANETGASLSVGDVPVASGSTENRAEASVDKNGEITVGLHADRKETSLVDTLGGAVDTVKEWLGLDKGKPSTRKVLKGALEKTPKERLAELLSKTYDTLAGYDLGPRDVETLIARAHDAANWEHAVRSPRALAPMHQLRVDLCHPRPDPEWLISEQGVLTEEEWHQAHRLAQARAIAQFMKDTGDPGMDALVNVLRKWGEHGVTRSQAEGLGQRYEWPPSLTGARERLEKAKRKAAGMDADLDLLVVRGGSAADVRQQAVGVVAELDAVYREVESCPDIRSARARAEMLDDIRRTRDEVSGAEHLHDDLLAGGAVKSMAHRLAEDRVPGLEVELASFKRQETALLAAAAAQGGKALLHTLPDLQDLYEFWNGKIVELRQLYRGANVPPDRWKVRPDASAPRRPDTEPDVEAMEKAWRHAGGGSFGSVRDIGAPFRGT